MVKAFLISIPICAAIVLFIFLITRPIARILQKKEDKKREEFVKWFHSLPPEQQKQYVEKMEKRKKETLEAGASFNCMIH